MCLDRKDKPCLLVPHDFFNKPFEKFTLLNTVQIPLFIPTLHPPSAFSNHPWDAMLTTSINGIKALMQTSLPRHTPLAVAGTASYNFAKKQGYTNILMPEASGTKHMATMLGHCFPKGGNMAYFHGDRVRTCLTILLRKQRIHINSYHAYTMKPHKQNCEEITHYLKQSIWGVVIASMRVADYIKKLLSGDTRHHPCKWPAYIFFLSRAIKDFFDDQKNQLVLKHKCVFLYPDDVKKESLEHLITRTLKANYLRSTPDLRLTEEDFL